MGLNIRAIINVLGLMLMINGAFMLTCLSATFYYKCTDLIPILVSATATIGLGLLMFVLSRIRTRPNIKRREGFLIVTLGWMVMALSGSLPYMLSGVLPGLADAYFESMSGFTTTGASVISDLRLVQKDILLWRSLTHWIGGMGIIVLAVAILPALGIGGMQLFAAESSGISHDKISPRISDTAKRLWGIYVGLTVAQIICMRLTGLGWFDSVCHSFGTVATAGFGNYNDSMMSFPVAAQYVTAFFMLLGGTNFMLLYFLLKGRWDKLRKDDELYTYLAIIGLFTFGVMYYLLRHVGMGWEASFRHSLFQVISIVTTTGFATADYTHWGQAMSMVFFMLLFVGAMAGSTTGGMKVVRHVVLYKNAFAEIRRQLHPNAVIPVRLNGRSLSQDVIDQITSFTIFYIVCFAVSTLAIAFTGPDFATSMSAAASCMGCTGPGIGNISPSFNFSFFSDGAKWILSWNMLLGRLELFTVLVLLSPYFWRVRG